MVLEVSLDSIEGLEICTKQQHSRLFEVYAIYTLNGGVNGFAPRLEALPEMKKSLQEALDSR